MDLGLFFPYRDNCALVDNESRIVPSYIKNPCDVLIGFADAGYLSDPHKRRSHTGYVFTMGNIAITWRSTKQTLVAASSNHAEIIALHEAVRECVWLRSIIKHIRGTSGLRSSATAKSPQN